MTDHSPDHAERAAAVATWTKVGGTALLNGEPPSMEIIYRAMLAYADERVAAALRGRDRVVEDLTTALHDAISRPAGVVPASAEPFYDWRRYARAALHDAKVMREEQPAAADNPATGDSR